MKLLLTFVALVAFTHAAPTTHTLEVGSNGVIGSVDSPLLSIVVNILKDEDSVVPGAVLEPVEAQPVLVVETPAIEIQPVTVVDTPTIEAQPVTIVDTSAIEAQPVTVVDTPAVEAQPVTIVDTPAIEAQPVTVVDSTPVNVVDSPVQPNPIDVISVSPVEPNPGQVVDVTPGLASIEHEANGNQIINVILNFVFGSDGSVSSVELPAQQLVGTARGL